MYCPSVLALLEALKSDVTWPGIKEAKTISRQSVVKVVFKRKDKKVHTLTTETVKIHYKQISNGPLTIFQRLCITKQSDDNMKRHFELELAPYPMSLFCEY